MKPSGHGTFDRSRAATTALWGVVLFVVGLMVWPGCALMPLPSKRTPIASRTSEQFKIKQSEQLTRAEVVARMGLPDAYASDVRVACYKVNDVTRRKVFLFLFIIPTSVEKRTAHDLGFIEYDEQDRVRRAGISTEYTSKAMTDSAREWVKK